MQSVPAVEYFTPCDCFYEVMADKFFSLFAYFTLLVSIEIFRIMRLKQDAWHHTTFCFLIWQARQEQMLVEQQQWQLMQAQVAAAQQQQQQLQEQQETSDEEDYS